MAGVAVGVIGAVASVIPSHRQCTIQIVNESTKYSLSNPRMWLRRGRCTVPLSPLIAASNTATALFTKTPHTARGSVGVFTYDLVKNGADEPIEKIAVLFNVPYDFIRYINEYAVGIFKMSTVCDKELHMTMYKKIGNSFIRGRAAEDPSLTYKGDHVTIMAAMSDSYQPVIKVQVTDTKR